MRHFKLRITSPISLIILAGLWLITYYYNPTLLINRSIARTQETKVQPHIAASRATTLPTLNHIPTPPESFTPTPESTRTAFLVVMENTNWAKIKGNNSAPYINNVLLPLAAHAEAYYNPPHLHPSEPNYIWLEGGTSFGITNDAAPRANHQSTSLHLVTLLDQQGISWKSYQEGISGTDCPLTSTGLYAPKHNPMIYFDDVTDTNNPHSSTCITHVRPLADFTTAVRPYPTILVENG